MLRRLVKALPPVFLLLTVLITVPGASTALADTVNRGSWAHTDLRAPFSTFADGTGDAPVGAWVDDQGRYHSAKSYFTFDLTPLRGRRVLSAGAAITETWAADCTATRATELWRTDLAERPTWQRQPAERALQPGGAPTGPCVAPYREWDVQEAVTTALASGATKLTLALRMAGNKQYEPKYGRRFTNDLQLFVIANTPPDVPTRLSIDSIACGEPFFNRVQTPTLRARLSDRDENSLTGRFTIRDVADPTNPRVFEQTDVPSGATAMVTLPKGLLIDGHTYELTVQAVDAHDTSPPTPVCRFTNDFTHPNAPGVASAEYPPSTEPGTGGTNVPGRFTFDPAGSDDVVGYHYYVGDRVDFGPRQFVPAGPDGRATVDFTPTQPYRHFLKVASVDRAGNWSTVVAHDFFVYDNAPRITAPESGELDVPVEVVLAPGMPGVVEYSYQVNGGATHTVAAGPDGGATVTVVPDEPGSNPVEARSRTAAGLVSGVSRTAIYLPLYEPTVVSTDYPDDGLPHGGVGVPGAFEFTSSLPGTTAFVYTVVWNGSESDEVVVPADQDGRATATIVPTEPGSHYLYVRARRANGGLSGGTFYDFAVRR